MAALALAGGIAWALLGSSLFVVRSVRVLVTGGPPVPRGRVLAAARIAPGTPLVRVDPAAVARRVERIAVVESARVSLSWPDAVVIWVRPRIPELAVPAAAGYDLIDPAGVVLGWRPARPPGLPVLAAPRGSPAALRGDPRVRAAGVVVRELPGWLRRRVLSVRAGSASAVTLVLRGGLTVDWGGTRRAAQKARELAILLGTGARRYDVSDPYTAVTSG